MSCPFCNWHKVLLLMTAPAAAAAETAAAAAAAAPDSPQLYGELQRGTPVTAVNGRTIQPHEVMSTPTTPGPCIVVVDCPSLEYLPGLQAQQALQQLQQECQQQQQVKKEEGGDGSAAAAAAAGGAGQNGNSGGSGGEAAPRKRFIVIHMGPRAVSMSAEYRGWCAGFGSGADQMFLSRDSQLCTTTLRAAQLQAQLNVIEPEVFPLQGFLDLKQRQQQLQGANGGGGSQPAAAAAAAAGRQGLDCPDGLVFTLVPARQQGINLDTAINHAPDFEAVQVRMGLVKLYQGMGLELSVQILHPNAQKSPQWGGKGGVSNMQTCPPRPQ
jgi:hypothetical protein